MRRKRRRSYKFTEKTHSKRAIVSAAMAGSSLIMYFVFMYLSYSVGGALSTYYGGFGFMAMLVAIAALVLSIPTLKEEDSFVLFPRLALGTSVLATLLWLGTYMEGILRG